MSTRYLSEPMNLTEAEVRRIATEEARKLIISPELRGAAVPGSLPRRTLDDIPVVTALPDVPPPSEGDEVYLSDGEGLHLSRFMAGAWVPVHGGAALVWTTATLINGWANLAPGTYPPPGYLIDNEGFVHLRGRMNGGASGTAAWTLPVGFRPAYEEDGALGAFAAAPVAGVFQITTAGSVVLYYAAGTTSVMLSGITFDTRV